MSTFKVGESCWFCLQIGDHRDACLTVSVVCPIPRRVTTGQPFSFVPTRLDDIYFVVHEFAIHLYA